MDNSKKDNQDINTPLLHLNISPLHYHIDNLTNVLHDLGFKFKVIAITESRLTTKKDPKDLNQYFLNEVLSNSNENTIIGCIYKHQKLALADFIQNSIPHLLMRI